MSSTKNNAMKILGDFLKICMLILGFSIIGEYTAWADEINFMNIICEGEQVIPNEAGIYYQNKGVELKLSEEVKDGENREKEALLDELSNEYPGQAFETKIDEYMGVSVFDGEGFSQYISMDGDSFPVEIMDAETNRMVALKFKRIYSCKFILGDITMGKVVRVLDKQYETKAYQIVLDNSKPEIIADSSVDTSNPLGDDTRYTLKIKDALGIKELKLYKNDKMIDEKNLIGDKRIIEYDYEITLFKENEGGDTIRLDAIDIAGNKESYIFSYTMDSAPPDIRIDGVNNGEIVSNSAQLKISTLDNYGPVKLFYKCRFTDRDGNEQILESVTTEFEGKAGETFRTYNNLGIYDIVCFSYDGNGNYSETIKCSFAVDNEVPVVRLDNVIDGMVYKDEVQIHAVLSKMFFENVSSDISCELRNEGGTQNLHIPPFEIKAQKNKNIYSFGDDGDYHVILSAEDSRGRKAKTECYFSIDKTPPSIDIMASSTEELDEKMVFGTIPKITVNAYDYHGGYTVNSKLYKWSESGTYLSEADDNIVSIGKDVNFDIAPKGEGQYMLIVLAKDNAGNQSEKRIEFTVDEKPPLIGYIDEFNEKYLKQFGLPKNFRDYITDLTKVNYKAYLNSKEISDCEIKKDGKYLLQIVAEDEAGNRSEKLTTFIVDTTMPKIIVNGIEGDGQVKKDGEIVLTLFDEDDYFKRVVVNGRQQPIIGDGRRVAISADAYGKYDISVVASDYAGNETTQFINTSCALSANPFTIELDRSEVKTLTKNENEIRENFFEKYCVSVIVILCAFVVATAVIFAVIARFDIKKLTCDTSIAEDKK